MVVSKRGRAAVYLTNLTDNKPSPIRQGSIQAKASPTSGVPSPLLLHAALQHGDPAGEASVFEGELSPLLAGRAVSVAMKLPLAGDAYELSFIHIHPGETSRDGKLVDHKAAVRAAPRDPLQPRISFS